MNPITLYLAPSELDYRRERALAGHGIRRWPRVPQPRGKRRHVR
jgi:hypothetical protein